MQRHAGTHRRADRRDFGAAHEHARMIRALLPGNAERGDRFDERCFHLPHEALNFSQAREFEDRITHELAWAVVREVAAALDLEIVDVAAC